MADSALSLGSVVLFVRSGVKLGSDRSVRWHTSGVLVRCSTWVCMLNACINSKNVCWPTLHCKSRAGAHGCRYNERLQEGKEQGSDLAKPLELLYIRYTTGRFSSRALQEVKATTCNVILLEQSGMATWAPRLAVNPRLWRKQASPPSASAQFRSQAGHPVLLCACATCALLQDVGVHAW